MSTDRIHLFSFINCTKKGSYNKKKENFPIPRFMNIEILKIKPNLTKQGILYGQSVNDKNGLVLEDPEIIKKFKGLVGEIISQILKAIFGKPIS